MRYQIPDNVLPGSSPRKAMHPYAVAAVFFLAGWLVGGVLAYINARWLGCPDKRQQGIRLGLIWLAALAMSTLAYVLMVGFDEAAWQHLIGSILNGLIALCGLLGGVVVIDRQIVIYNAHSMTTGFQWKPVVLAVAAIVLTYLFLEWIRDYSLIRRLIGAGLLRGRFGV